MFHRALLKSYIIAAIIIVLCLLPGQTFPKVEQSIIGLDKLVHILMYIPFAWTLVFGFKLQNRFSSLQQNAFLIALAIVVFLGVFTELLQKLLTPDRFAEYLDVVADIVGGLLGLLTYRWGERLILFWNKIWDGTTRDSTGIY